MNCSFWHLDCVAALLSVTNNVQVTCHSGVVWFMNVAAHSGNQRSRRWTGTMCRAGRGLVAPETWALALIRAPPSGVPCCSHQGLEPIKYAKVSCTTSMQSTPEHARLSRQCCIGRAHHGMVGFWLKVLHAACRVPTWLVLTVPQHMAGRSPAGGPTRVTGGSAPRLARRPASRCGVHHVLAAAPMPSADVLGADMVLCMRCVTRRV